MKKFLEFINESMTSPEDGHKALVADGWVKKSDNYYTHPDHDKLTTKGMHKCYIEHHKGTWRAYRQAGMSGDQPVHARKDVHSVIKAAHSYVKKMTKSVNESLIDEGRREGKKPADMSWVKHLQDGPGHLHAAGWKADEYGEFHHPDSDHMINYHKAKWTVNHGGAIKSKHVCARDAIKAAHGGLKEDVESLDESYHEHAESDAQAHDGAKRETKHSYGDTHGAKLAAADHVGYLGKKMQDRGYTKIQHSNTFGDVNKPAHRLYHALRHGKDHYVHMERDDKGNVRVRSYHA